MKKVYYVIIIAAVSLGILLKYLSSDLHKDQSLITNISFTQDKLFVSRLSGEITSYKIDPLRQENRWTINSSLGIIDFDEYSINYAFSDFNNISYCIDDDIVKKGYYEQKISKVIVINKEVYICDINGMLIKWDYNTDKDVYRLNYRWFLDDALEILELVQEAKKYKMNK